MEGWEHKRSGGGTNHIACRKALDEYRCDACMRLILSGSSPEQTDLFMAPLPAGVDNPPLWKESCRLADIFVFHQFKGDTGRFKDKPEDIAKGIYEVLRLGRTTSEVFESKVKDRSRRDRSETWGQFKFREFDFPAAEKEKADVRARNYREGGGGQLSRSRSDRPESSRRAVAKTIRLGGAAPSPELPEDSGEHPAQP